MEVMSWRLRKLGLKYVLFLWVCIFWEVFHDGREGPMFGWISPPSRIKVCRSRMYYVTF